MGSEPRAGAVGLIMAGGQGSRMRAAGITVPKALVPVAGVPLLERSLRPYARAGIPQVWVAVSDAVPEVVAFATGPLTGAAEALGLTLRVLREAAPRGNIGAARDLADRPETVLVTCADDLSTLPLRRILDRHRAAGAALTLATHAERFQLPYGELTITPDDLVGDYVEKPVRRPWVSSALFAVEPAALALLPEGQPAGMVDLFHAVRAAGGLVAALRHDAPWVDVNDAASLARAEELLLTAPADWDV